MSLSPREQQVLDLAASGLTDEQIAWHLHLSENTVDTYMRRIFDKLGANSRPNAVALAFINNIPVTLYAILVTQSRD